MYARPGQVADIALRGFKNKRFDEQIGGNHGER